jgi:hypothetical protein
VLCTVEGQKEPKTTKLVPAISSRAAFFPKKMAFSAQVNNKVNN